MSIITGGIDLAKNVFAVQGVDDNGKAVLVKPNVPFGNVPFGAIRDRPRFIYAES